MAKKSYLELAYEDDIKKNTGKDRDKVTYKDLAALDDKETYGKVYNDAMQKLSNPAIWREPKEFSDLRKRADAAAYGQSGDLGKFFSDVRDMSDERAKYYAQFGSKNKFVSNQIDGMDKRQVREPSAPVAKADILPKNTNDYLRFQSDQMMGAGPQTIGSNPIAEMMEKQKFFQQTAHDPKALQFSKFTGEYDQMGRDDRLDFEKSAIDVERKKLSEDNKGLESEYYNQYAKLYGDNMYFDDYEAEGKKLSGLSDKREAYADRLSMLDSMQGQAESTQRWNETKDKYVPYMAAAGFDRESRYDQSKLKGQAAQEYASQVNDPDYTYNYINNPELWEAKTGNNQIFQYENAHLQYMTDEERGIYNYLYKNQGPESAKQMLGDMAEQLRARRSYEQEKETAQYAKNDPVGSFFAARGRNLQKAVIGPGQIVATLMGAGADDPIFDINRVSESIDATNAQELSKAFGGVKIPFLDADAGEVVYGIMSSGADAAAAMGIGKLLLGSNTAIQGIMSSGAASSAMKSGLERGMEPWKAATMGVMGGLIEAVTEKYSIEALFSPVDKKAWRFFLKNIFTEGSEELASSALNRITDGIMNADKSEIAQRAIEIARTNGISLEQAKKQARTEWMQQAGVEFISGAVMGGAFAAPKALVGSVKNKSNPTPPTVTEQIANKEAEYAKKESEAYENAARERMDFETRDGEAAKQYAELVKLVNESFPEESETKAKIAEAATIDAKRMTEIATNAMQELRARMQAEASPEVLKLSEALTQTVEGIFAGMQTDRNAITDKYTAGLDEGLKAEIKGKNDVSYAKGYGIAHALGQMGVSNDTIAKATGFEDAQKAAEEGRAKWDIELPKAKNKAAELRKTLPLPGKGSVTYHSNVKQDALTTGQRDQIGLLEQVAKPMGYKFVMVEFGKDAAGNYITENGKIAPNGYFRDTDGTIYIDVNAGKTAGRMVEDTIIPQTAGHELTHYLKANAPDLFRAYGATVIEELSAKGQDINALIAQKIGRAKQSSIGVEAALEEVIADSSAMMLQNTQAVQTLAKTNPGLFEKITEWVKDFIDRVRKAFSKVEGTPEAKALMSMRDGVMKYADNLQKMWDDMAVSVAQAKLDENPVTVARRDVPAKPENPVSERINTAYTSDGQAVDYHYEIAPVGSLIPSNLETSLEPNPDYPQELQPRDRTRAASQQQVEEIANKLNPALLGESADVGTGAPFVGPDMVVESGNGRILAITRAMRQGKGLTYTQWLKDNAARFGIDPAKVDNSSVLVRVRDTEVNRPEFVQKANESQVATYSDSESAVSDAKKVTPAMLEMANMDSGDINSAGNSSFVASFISKVVPAAERGRMMDASGKLSKSGENRVRTALFQMAYEDGYLTEQMAEASDDTSKNILKAMTAVAPRLALMNDAMKKGTLSDYPIGQAIAEAYRIVQRQKRLGVSVDRYINQQSLVRQDTPAHWMLLEMFNENRNAPNRMADALNSILNAAERQGNPNQMLMPGLEAERPSVEGIVREGLNRYGEEQMAASERYQERDSDDAPLTAEQIEYFKDSKVRDEQGRLLKVYHGTTRGFTEFKTNLPGQTIKDTIGSHFGTEKAANDRLGVVGKEKSPYGENVPSVMDVFLNITNPLLKRGGGIMTESELNAYLKRVGKKLNIPDRELGSSSQFSRVPSYVGETIQAYLKEQGYDGIPYINSWEDRGNVSYIAFNPEQIKSTTNLTPTSSPDIRYQERVMTTPRGVEVIQNATGEELSQMRKEFMERTGLPRSMADVRSTYDEQGNDYTWIAYEGMHASVEPYINKRFNTRTHQQWEWWKRPDKDEYPTDYSYIRIDDRFQERDPDYRTKRDILAGAFDSVAETEVEKRNLKEYKNLIGSLNRMEEEARGLRQANTAEWKKAEPDRAKVNENKKRIFEIEKRIFSMDKKLIQMQNAAPLRNVLIRQKKAYERKAVEKYKGKRDTNELNDALDLRADRAAKRLMKHALTPDKNSHVPDGMRTDITNLLTALDLASEDKAGNVRDSYRARSWQEALTALGIRMKNADMVAATIKGNDEAGPALLVDPALQDKIESLIKRNDGVVRYRNLKTKEKQTVVEILESVSVAVSEANKKFSADRTKTISDVADKTIDYAKAQREKKLRGEIAERLSTFLNIDMADAFTFFDSLGEGGQEILKGLYNEGFSKLVRNTEDARAFFDGLNAKYGKYGMSTWGGKNATPKNFKVASGTLTMTPAQVMELYMLNKREQARGHIYGQGIRVERIRSRKPGKAAVLWQKDALTVTPAEIEAITSTLTEQQKQVAEEFGAFFGRTSTKWGNEVSMTLYGYYKFIEQNYYPIHSDTNFTMTQDPNSADMLYALLNIGATKDTVKFANNPIIISDIFDTVTRHITDMANYNAFAPALVDAMKWFNYKRIVKDEAGNMRLESVKGGIERMMGAAGKNYVINLLKAVNGIKNPQVASGFSGMVNSAIGKFKTSAVGANARVVLQQHASYVRGSALLSPAAMAAAYFRSPRRGMQMARKYSAIAAWKHMGYFDMNIGRQMSDLINGNESTAEKIRQAAMKPAGLADDFTIGVLWNAAEIELGKTYKGDKRSEEFYKLVGEKLTEVIDRTQVVDTVFHRSQIMRDKDGLTKIATNFMSEPIKTYNLLMGAVKTGDLKTIARTGTVALLSYVVVAMAAGFSDAARDKDKEKGWQGYWESWMKNALGIGGSFFESNVWDNMNPLNMIPFGKDVYGLATGYSPSRPDLQAAQRMIWAANDWMGLFKGEDKDLYKLIYNTANAISTASGIPISNVMRDVKALYDTLDPRVVVGDNTKVVYQRFADALANGEEEKALAYYNALIDSGRDSVTIRTQAMQRYKDEETVIAAAEAKKAGDYAAYEKAIDQAVKDGIPRDMAIKAADGLSTGKAEKTKPERAKTIDEVKKAMDYKDTYTYESNDLMTVIEKGDNVTAKKIIDKMLKEGRKKDAISGSISSHFKPIYLEAYKKGQASNLKAKLLTMYALLGYDRNDKSKDIDAWLKQK